MAGFFGNAAKKGFFGAAGAYGANKGFRNGVNEFLMGSDSEMRPYNEDSLQALMSMLNGEGIEGNQNFQGGSNFLQQLFGNDPSFWQNFEAPYMQNFNERIAPGIAERFAGMGTGGGALSSSGLNNSLAQAGRGLQSDLAAMRGGMQLQGLNANLAYAQQPYANKMNAAQAIPNQYYERPGEAGFLQSMAPAAGKAATSYFTGGM